MTMLSELEKWYVSQCNGDWEHQWGIDIGTLDNPGWTFKVDLMGTRKQGAALPLTRISRNERDWISYSVQDNRFEAACGPENLSETISLFLQWFESN
jgi:hypothetical protein